MIVVHVAVHFILDSLSLLFYLYSPPARTIYCCFLLLFLPFYYKQQHLVVQPQQIVLVCTRCTGFKKTPSNLFYFYNLIMTSFSDLGL